MKESFLKNKKGITLIALVITVVVMLILAGVAISAIVGGEGLFSKMQEAVGVYENATKSESDELQNLLEMTDIEAPSVPTVRWAYKKGVYDNDSFFNNIKGIEMEYFRDETGSYTICRTTSDTPEIEILNINGITDIYATLVGITSLNDDINYKIYYTENDTYTDSNCITGTFAKESNGGTISVPKGNYKKIKIILGDKAGLEYRFGTIDLRAAADGINANIIRNRLNSTDNVEVKKYQYSEDKINWYDCKNDVSYTEASWNKIVYYRAVDWAGNVSESTEACVINLDKEKPTVSIETSNINSTSFTLKANGQDTKSGMYRYDFYVDGVLEETIQSSESEVLYEVTNKEPATEYKCKVVAYDLVGNNATSQEITVTTLEN